MAERSGGNPLFAEEMVNRLMEEDTVEAEALPSTVQSLLAARLDSLTAPERRLLLHASVVGQTFWEGSLEARPPRRRVSTSARRARRAGGEGPAGPEPRAAAWRASASTRSSTC